MDRIQIVVLADGRIKTTTGTVSPEAHLSAEQFLDLVTRLTGGPAEVVATTPHAEGHTHDDAHSEHHHA